MLCWIYTVSGTFVLYGFHGTSVLIHALYWYDMLVSIHENWTYEMLNGTIHENQTLWMFPIIWYCSSLIPFRYQTVICICVPTRCTFSYLLTRSVILPYCPFLPPKASDSNAVSRGRGGVHVARKHSPTSSCNVSALPWEVSLGRSTGRAWQFGSAWYGSFILSTGKR